MKRGCRRVSAGGAAAAGIGLLALALAGCGGGKPTEEAIALTAYIQKLGNNLKWREEGVEQVKKIRAARGEEVEK